MLAPSQWPGVFVTFEGVDGCGKSTQWQAVSDALRHAYPNREIVQTRNPGGTFIGQAIRRLLLDPPEANTAAMVPMAELMLYMADRAQHVAEVVKPALERGAIVLCDRFVDSSVAYQGAARGIDPNQILTLNALACGGVTPHVTLLFDADIELLAKRIQARGGKDRLELEGMAFQQKVRDGFKALAAQEPQRIQVLNAAQAIEVLTEQCLNHIKQRL